MEERIMGIKIGLVGLGSFGSAFAGLFKSHPLVDKIAFCDLEKDRVASFASNPAFQDKFDEKDVYLTLDEIIQSDVDAVVIITQPWLHAEQAIKAMNQENMCIALCQLCLYLMETKY
jgi:predicted dehydrogenase